MYTAFSLLVVLVVVAVAVYYSTLPFVVCCSETQTPTMQPTTYREKLIQDMIEERVLDYNIQIRDLEQNDPRYLALDWILHGDRLQLNADSPNIR
jgi:hypothetical protein